MSVCVLQQQTVLLAVQGGSERLLGFKDSRIPAEKELSISKMFGNPSTCAALRARAWSRTDTMLCSPYERQVLIDVPALQLLNCVVDVF